jgi:hypothetical protein
MSEPAHSIYVYCLSCSSWGVNLPGNKCCANCGSSETVEYYPISRDQLDAMEEQNESFLEQINDLSSELTSTSEKLRRVEAFYLKYEKQFIDYEAGPVKSKLIDDLIFAIRQCPPPS